MAQNDLHDRTLAFAVSIARFAEGLPRTRAADIFGRQLIRSGSSVGANYRSASRAQSTAHIVSKLSTVEEEADECGYWLELLVRTGSVSRETAAPLIREASELTAIMVASKKSLRGKLRTPARRNSKFVIRNSAEK